MILPAVIYSPDQIEAYILELGNYISWHRSKRIQKQVKVDAASTEPSLSQELSILIEQNCPEVNVENLEAVQLELKRILDHAPRVTLTLAAIPGGVTKKAIVEWLRREVSPDILVRFEANRQILGGVMLRTKNRIYDLSFRKQITGNKNRLVELIHV